MLEASGKAARNYRWTLAFWLGLNLLAFTVIGIDILHDEWVLHAILNRPGQTVGHWTVKDCGRKGGSYFTYFVEGQPYYGMDAVGLRDCRDIELGGPVDVTYDVKKPERFIGARLEYIAPMLAREPVGFVFLAVWSAATYVFMVLPRWRDKRDEAQALAFRNLP